jgi:Pilus formation protein N terminal region
MGPVIFVQVLLAYLGTAVVVPVGETKLLRLEPDQRAFRLGDGGYSFSGEPLPFRPETHARIRNEKVVSRATVGSMFCVVGKSPGMTTVTVWGSDRKRHSFLVVVPRPKG